MVQPCPGKQTASYISLKAFDAAIVDLQRQGVVDTVIVASLAEIAIKTAVAEKEHAQMHLDGPVRDHESRCRRTPSRHCAECRAGDVCRRLKHYHQ